MHYVTPLWKMYMLDMIHLMAKETDNTKTQGSDVKWSWVRDK